MNRLLSLALAAACAAAVAPLVVAQGPTLCPFGCVEYSCAKNYAECIKPSRTTAANGIAGPNAGGTFTSAGVPGETIPGEIVAYCQRTCYAQDNGIATGCTGQVFDTRTLWFAYCKPSP